jgi:hypothetical protein
MPTGVWPVAPYIGSSFEDEHGDSLIKELGDGTVQEYIRSTALKERWTFKYNGIAKTEADAIDAFVEAHRTATTYAGRTFSIYDPRVVGDTIDLSGSSPTGKRVGLLLSGKVIWQIDGKCRHSASFLIRIVG